MTLEQYTYLYSLYSLYVKPEDVTTLGLFKCWRARGELLCLRLSFTSLQSPVWTVCLTGFSKLLTARKGDFSFSNFLISKLAGEPDLDLRTGGLSTPALAFSQYQYQYNSPHWTWR